MIIGQRVWSSRHGMNGTIIWIKDDGNAVLVEFDSKVNNADTGYIEGLEPDCKVECRTGYGWFFWNNYHSYELHPITRQTKELSDYYHALVGE